MASGASCSRKLTMRKAGEDCSDRSALAAGPVGTLQTQPQMLGLESQLQELLPGIPDHVTLTHITTRLPWTDSHVLPSVSRSWNNAIKSREVFNSRVHFHSTETLVVLSYKAKTRKVLALYSMKRNRFYSLPSVPGIDQGIYVPSGRCLSIDGRVYVLGVSDQKPRISFYVLDLVGQRRWRWCANMPQERHEFGCGAVNGKIYVIDGVIGDDKPIFGALVYDPKVNVWSPIAPMPSLRRPTSTHVAGLGGELFLHSGAKVDVSNPESEEDEAYFGDNTRTGKLILEVYSPIKNEWREVDSLPPPCDDMDALVFLANGYFYVLTDSAIYWHDTGKRRWIKVHAFSRVAFGPFRSVHLQPTSVLAANGELLATFHWCKQDIGIGGISLFQSQGFGGNDKRIVWKKVKCGLTTAQVPFLYGTVEL